jgi:hypothetical protein
LKKKKQIKTIKRKQTRLFRIYESAPINELSKA